MKIVHVIIGLEIGGAELFLYRLINQSKNNVNHVVISLTNLGTIGESLRSEGILVICLNLKNIFSVPKVVFRLYINLIKLKPDVVHTWMYHADFLGGIVSKMLGIKKIIWCIRTTDVTLGKSKSTIVLRKLCAYLSYYVPSHIVCVAYKSKNIHIKVGYDESKIIVISNGFDLNKLKLSANDRLDFRNSIGVKDNDIVIGSIGRFNIIKNQEFFIEVANSLIKENVSLKFVIIGRDNNSYNKKLTKWISDRKLQKHFILLGQRSDVSKCLNGLDIFCLHSKTEGFPNVLGEAMAIGVLSVSLDVGDAAFLLNNSDLIASDGDLSNLITSVINWTPEKKQKVIMESKKRVENTFCMSVIAQKYIDIYES